MISFNFWPASYSVVMLQKKGTCSLRHRVTNVAVTVNEHPIKNKEIIYRRKTVLFVPLEKIQKKRIRKCDKFWEFFFSFISIDKGKNIRINFLS